MRAKNLVSVLDGAFGLDDKDWRILKMIAEEKNITKAAARLFISHPAFSQPAFYLGVLLERRT